MAPALRMTHANKCSTASSCLSRPPTTPIFSLFYSYPTVPVLVLVQSSPLSPISRETFLCNPSLLQYLNIPPSRNRLVQNPSILPSMDMTSVAMTRSLALFVMGGLETVQKSSLPRPSGQIRP
jgi:hypothetical protein